MTSTLDRPTYGDPAIPAPVDTTERDSRPRRRWPWGLRAAVAMLLMFVQLVPAMVVTSLVPALHSQDDGAAAALNYFVVGGVLVTGTSLGLVALLMRFVERRPLREAGLRWDRGSLPAFLAGTILVVAITLVLGYALRGAGLLRPVTDDGSSAWLVVAVTVTSGLFVQAFPEELVFRGWLMQGLSWRNRWLLALVSATAFAIMHLFSDGGQQSTAERVIYLALPFGFAFLAAALYLRTGQLWAAVGVHFGDHVADAVTSSLGIGSGPVMWVAFGVACTGVGCVLLARGGHTLADPHRVLAGR